MSTTLTRQAAPACHSVTLFEWMWAGEGLGLRPSAELFVYASIYDATSRGSGALAVTTSDLAGSLGYERGTVQRALTHLEGMDLIWSPYSIKLPTGGRPVRAWSCCPGPVACAMGALVVEGDEALGAVADAARVPASAAVAPGPQRLSDDAGDGDGGTGRPTCDAEGAESFQHSREGNVASRPVSPSNVASHRVTQGLPDDSPHCQCGVASANQCGAEAFMAKRHIAQQGTQPAETAVFNKAPICTYNLSNTYRDSTVADSQVVTGAGDATSDAGDDRETARDTDAPPKGGASPDAKGEDGAPALSDADLAEFRELVRRSVLPVDEEFMGANLKAYARLIDAGVPADVIVAAYTDYSYYQHGLRQKTGEWHPMHLLTWLTQKPNKNIRYVLEHRDQQWIEERKRSEPPRGARWKRQGESPSHENPQIMRCRGDKGAAVWFVTDERGGRRIPAADGVESPTRVLKLYELMYAQESRERAERSRSLRRGERGGDASGANRGMEGDA